MRIDHIIEDLARAFRPHYPIDASNVLVEWGSKAHPGATPFTTTWDEPSSAFDFLERNHDALRFLGPAVLGDHGFVVAVLRRATELDTLPIFVIHALSRDPDPERFTAYVDQFTPIQRLEIASALIALEAVYRGNPRRHSVTRALDSYWRSLISTTD